MLRVILLMILISVSDQLHAEVVLKLGKNQTVSELLWHWGMVDLYDKDGKIGNLRKVLFHNKLSMYQAKKLEEGAEIKIPKELEHFFDLERYNQLIKLENKGE